MKSGFRKIFFFASVFFLLIFALASLPHEVYASQTNTLLPISDGFYAQWTPKSGSTHYTQVNETTCDGQTTYVSTPTVGNRDSYGIDLSSIPNGATLTQIDIKPCASRNSNGTSNSDTLNVFYRLNGANSADMGSYGLTGITPIVLSTASFTGLSNVKSSTSTLEIGAVFSSGNKGARLSQISTVITYTPLNAPSNLSAVALSTESSQLTWANNASNNVGFKIERSIDDINFSQISSVGATTTSYIDPNVIGTYYYRVRAYNSGGDSSYSNTASVTVPLNSPSNLSASASGSAALLSWIDNSANEDGFAIERSTDSANFSQINTVGVDIVNYTDSNLSSGTYYYRVRAFKSSIYSLYSNTSSVVIP